MKEIVRQTPELREAVYSLINRDVERALSGLESVKPSQVPVRRAHGHRSTP